MALGTAQTGCMLPATSPPGKLPQADAARGGGTAATQPDVRDVKLPWWYSLEVDNG